MELKRCLFTFLRNCLVIKRSAEVEIEGMVVKGVFVFGQTGGFYVITSSPH